MIEIFKTALPLAEIAIIKRDFDLLRKLLPSLTSDVQTQMVPYSALFCYEAWYTSKNIIHLFVWNKQVSIP